MCLQAYRVSIRTVFSEQLRLLWVCRVETLTNLITKDDTNAIPYTVHFLSRSQRKLKAETTRPNTFARPDCLSVRL
jgi:hypothetical protein